MGRILDTVIAHLDEYQLFYERIQDESSLSLHFGGITPPLRGRIVVDEEHGILHLHIFLPVFVPEERRAAAAECIVRLNSLMMIGHFEMDFADGEVLYRATAMPGEGPIEPDQVRALVAPAVQACMAYTSTLAQVVFAGAEPAEAIERATADEGDEDPELTEKLDDLLEGALDQEADAGQVEEEEENDEDEAKEDKPPKRRRRKK